MTARSNKTVQGLRNRLLTKLALTLVQRQGRRTSLPRPPLFIIGSGRSGNTLVRRVLMATGEIFIPPETFVLGDIIEGWARGSLLTWRERVWLFCAYFEKHRHFHTFGHDTLNAFASDAIGWPKSRRNLPTLIDGFYRYLDQSDTATNMSRWGDKTPYNTFHLDAIDAAFPNAQYLWLVRDGRDVALSYVEAGLFDDFPEAAVRWSAANEACAQLARRKGRSVRRQPYEELVSSPETVFAEVCAWAGLPFRPQMLTEPTKPLGDVEALAHHSNVTRPISPASIGRWRDRLGPEELDSLPDVFWSQMTALGYDKARRPCAGAI